MTYVLWQVRVWQWRWWFYGGGRRKSESWTNSRTKRYLLWAHYSQETYFNSACFTNAGKFFAFHTLDQLHLDSPAKFLHVGITLRRIMDHITIRYETNKLGPLLKSNPLMQAATVALAGARNSSWGFGTPSLTVHQSTANSLNSLQKTANGEIRGNHEGRTVNRQATILGKR